ncbi:MAG: hypothetical protein ACXWPM_09955, partial [Bdellovibrionota bacterium]
KTTPGASVQLDASWGSHPQSWLEGLETPKFVQRSSAGTIVKQAVQTPLLRSLLEATRPSITIIALGSNLYSGPKEWVSATVKKMVNEIRRTGSRCVWIGPPQMRAHSGQVAENLVAVLREAAKDCSFIDSLPLTRYPAAGGDGVHYDSLGPSGEKLAAAWANAVLVQLKSLIDIPAASYPVTPPETDSIRAR